MDKRARRVRGKARKKTNSCPAVNRNSIFCQSTAKQVPANNRIKLNNIPRRSKSHASAQSSLACFQACFQVLRSCFLVASCVIAPAFALLVRKNLRSKSFLCPCLKFFLPLIGTEWTVIKKQYTHEANALYRKSGRMRWICRCSYSSLNLAKILNLRKVWSCTTCDAL